MTRLARTRDAIALRSCDLCSPDHAGCHWLLKLPLRASPRGETNRWLEMVSLSCAAGDWLALVVVGINGMTLSAIDTHVCFSMAAYFQISILFPGNYVYKPINNCCEAQQWCLFFMCYSESKV